LIKQLLGLINASEALVSPNDHIISLFKDEVIQLINGVQFKNSQGEMKIMKGAIVFCALDTIAHQHFCKMQGSGSNTGCYMCQQFKGTNFEHKYGHIVFPGHRRFLDMTHRFRNMSLNNSFI
jgi:hypothetical protein